MLEFIMSKKFYLPIIYIALGLVVYLIVSTLLNKSLKYKKNKRKETIIDLVKNVFKYLVVIFIVLAILEVYGINTTKIIASLSVAAVVIGLAFQDIVKDFLSGIFIIFDNEYKIGDIIEINGFKGEVIELGLKTTKIKAYTGEVKILTNSSFTEVINYSLYNSLLLVDINVSYDTDIDKLEEVLTKLKPKLAKIENVKEDIQLLGVEQLDNSSIVYRILITCVATTQYGIKREVLKLIKEELDKNKIEIPYNKLDVYVKNK